MADMTHFRSSESLGQRRKVVEHTHKPVTIRNLSPLPLFVQKLEARNVFVNFPGKIDPTHMANIDHFRSSESLGQRGKVVEHTHKPQDGRRFQPSISFRSKVRGEKRFFRVFQFGSLLDRNFGT